MSIYLGPAVRGVQRALIEDPTGGALELVRGRGLVLFKIDNKDCIVDGKDLYALYAFVRLAIDAGAEAS